VFVNPNSANSLLTSGKIIAPQMRGYHLLHPSYQN